MKEKDRNEEIKKKEEQINKEIWEQIEQEDDDSNTYCYRLTNAEPPLGAVN